MIAFRLKNMLSHLRDFALLLGRHQSLGAVLVSFAILIEFVVAMIVIDCFRLRGQRRRHFLYAYGTAVFALVFPVLLAHTWYVTLVPANRSGLTSGLGGLLVGMIMGPWWFAWRSERDKNGPRP